MPISFTLTDTLLGPGFIGASPSYSCGTGAAAVNVVAYSVPINTAIGTLPAGVGTTTYETFDLCAYTKAVAQDVTNSLATTTNANFSLLATTVNQIIQYLNCEGFGDCVLTGPSGCCVDSTARPTEIRISVPKLINGTSFCYFPQASVGPIVPVTRNFDNGDHESKLLFM